MVRPGYFPGAPPRRPLREVWKKFMSLVEALNSRLELNSSRPATPRARPMAMKIPMEVGLAFLLIDRTCSGGFRRRVIGRRLAARQEFTHGGIGGLLQQFTRVALRPHGAGVAVEKDSVVGNREDALQIVGDDYKRGTQAVAQLQNQPIKVPRTDGVKARRRFI